MSSRGPLPRLLLGGESLTGISGAGRAAMAAMATRYADAGAVAGAFAAARGAGAGGVLVSPSRLVRGALERSAGLPVWALLPNVPEYVRDSADTGLVGAALQRVRRARPGTLLRLGITGLTHASAVLAGDFSGTVPLLLELEMAALGVRRVEGMVLAAPLTDLALAGRHHRFFRHVCAFARSRFRCLAGFETHNLGHLLRALREWEVLPDLVIGPVNPRGFRMKPSPGELLSELRRSGVPVLAKDVGAAGAVPLGEGARYARGQGAHGIVADLAELGDVGAEIRALADGAPQG